MRPKSIAQKFTTLPTQVPSAEGTDGKSRGHQQQGKDASAGTHYLMIRKTQGAPSSAQMREPFHSLRTITKVSQTTARF